MRNGRTPPLAEPRNPVSAVAFSRDGRRLVSAGFDRQMVAWDVTTGRRLQTFGPCDGLVLGVAISPDGSRLASAGEDKTVHVWEAATGREVLDLHGHTELSQGVAFSPDGQRLASSGEDGTIRVWDATPCGGTKPRRHSPLVKGPVKSGPLPLAPTAIASPRRASARRPVKVWDAGSGQVTVEFAGHKSVVFCVAWQSRRPADCLLWLGRRAETVHRQGLVRPHG
jgi:WD40 repeat protein